MLKIGISASDFGFQENEGEVIVEFVKNELTWIARDYHGFALMPGITNHLYSLEQRGIIAAWKSLTREDNMIIVDILLLDAYKIYERIYIKIP